MKKITVTVETPSKKRVVGYQHKNCGHIYILGSGSYNGTTGEFTEKAWEASTFESLSQNYKPLYSGDVITITQTITL